MTAAAQRDLFAALETDAEYKARIVPRLIELARALAIGSLDRRCSSSRLRRAAVERGVLTGNEKGRRLSFIHGVFPKAGFKPTDVFERSDIAQSHRNLNRLWYLPTPDELNSTV